MKISLKEAISSLTAHKIVDDFLGSQSQLARASANLRLFSKRKSLLVHSQGSNR